MFSTNQVPAQIEQIANRSMDTQESLRLPYQLEPTHPSLPGTSRL